MIWYIISYIICSYILYIIFGNLLIKVNKYHRDNVKGLFIAAPIFGWLVPVFVLMIELFDKSKILDLLFGKDKY